MKRSDNQPVVELKGITKRYGSVLANDAVHLSVGAGEIHALIGENGAGKSTLMKIIYGVVTPDAGEVLWQGRPVTFSGPAAARKAGIGMVFQHFSLFDAMTVAENISLAVKGSLTGLSRRIVEVGRSFAMPVDPGRPVHTLSVGERQQVEIIRCLLQNPKLLILDEPTSVLNAPAVEQLFAALRRLATEGCSILYISHKLEEVRQLCDTATVLRGGRAVGAMSAPFTDTAAMARLMIGHDLPPRPAQVRRAKGDTVLSVSALTSPGQDRHGVGLRDVSFHVAAGEIVGIAGVSGNGQQELLRLLSGEQRALPNQVVISGAPVGSKGVEARRSQGLAFVPEERLGRGAVPSLSLEANALLTLYGNGLASFGLLRRSAIAKSAASCIEMFDVRCSGPAASAESLSGGNLQKSSAGRSAAIPD